MSLNLAPLVDVMMCLIIFFLLASRLVQAQNRPLDLARATAARDAATDERAGQIVVNVRPAPNGQPPAELVIFGWDGARLREQVLAPTELPAFLEQRAEAARQRGEPARCLIRADRRVCYGDVESVLRACGQAGIQQVTFSARPDDGGEPEAAAGASR
jgi:biopolymer transport protein ExbD